MVTQSPRQLVYLACPYSHPDAGVRESRFLAANRCAAQLMGMGVLVFSPISHTHPIAEAGGLPLGWDYWEQYDRVLLAASKAVLVCAVQGFEDSKGLQAEIGIAGEMGIPVGYLFEPENEKLVEHYVRAAGLVGMETKQP